MKKLVVVLILTITGLISKGQTGPVFQYNHPSKQTLFSLATSETMEGLAYRSYLVEAINLGLKDTTLRVSLSNIDDIFSRLYLEEFYLLENEYSNSGYNPTKGRMVPGVGHAWTGFGWVFRIGSFSIRLIKGDCGNILKTPVLRKAFAIQQTIPLFVPKEEPPIYTPPIKTYESPKKEDPQPYKFVPEKTKKKFFKRLGVKIGCFTVGIAGVGGILYAILHKGPSAPHGTMSNGRAADDSSGTTTTTNNNGGRGD